MQDTASSAERVPAVRAPLSPAASRFPEVATLRDLLARHPSFREVVAAEIETLIALLDEHDGDADLEPLLGSTSWRDPLGDLDPDLGYVSNLSTNGDGEPELGWSDAEPGRGWTANETIGDVCDEPHDAAWETGLADLAALRLAYREARERAGVRR